MAQCVKAASSTIATPDKMGWSLSEHISVCIFKCVCINPLAHCKSALVGLCGNTATIEGSQQMNLPISFCAQNLMLVSDDWLCNNGFADSQCGL